MLPDGVNFLTYFSCIDENFFVPMRDARGYRTRMYTIYINNTLPPALAVHEIYRDIFGPLCFNVFDNRDVMK